MSDLIKKIKIKKQDGTFTDYIPIGAEAQNISTSDGDSVQLKLKKKPYYYNSIADMKTDIKLKVGDMAVTLGYYKANDGGSAEYIIVDDETLVDDGGSIHVLTNGLRAKLLNNEITPELFGYSDDIGLTINKILNSGIKTIKLNSKNYICKTTIDLHDKTGITIYGNNKTSSIIVGQTSNTPVINMVGTVNIKLEDFGIKSKPSITTTNPSTLGIVIARSENHLSSQGHIFKNLDISLKSGDLTINENYGSICLYNYSGESFLIDNCWFQSDLPIFMTHYDLLGIGAYYGGYSQVTGRSTTDFTITNDTYILSDNNLCMKFDTCHSININNIYLNNKTGGSIFEFNGNSQNGYETDNIFIDNIRIEGTVEHLIHLLENTRFRCYSIKGASNTITDSEILFEQNSSMIQGTYNFSSSCSYLAKMTGNRAWITNSLVVLPYSKNIAIYGFDNNMFIGSTYTDRENITSFTSIGISSTGEAVFKNKNSIIFSYAIPTETTNHQSGDICFCSNAGSNVLCWQYKASTQEWLPIYKVTTPTS